MRMKKVWKGLVIAMFALTAVVGSLLFGVNAKAKAFVNVREYSLQNQNDGVILSVEKVLRPVSWSGETMTYLDSTSESINASNYKKIITRVNTLNPQGEPVFYKDIENPNVDPDVPTTTTKTIVRNGGSVMLNDIYQQSSFEEVENIMVSFGSYGNANSTGGEVDNGQKLSVLTVSAFLNGEEIQVGTREAINGFTDFTMFLDLKSAIYATGDNAGQTVANQEGRYDLSFTYHRTVNGAIQPAVSVNFSFYLLSRNNYTKEQAINSSVSYSTQPRFANVDGNNNNYQFNYNTNSFPTLSLDLAKYDVTFTRTYNEIMEQYDVEYDYAQNRARIAKTLLNTTTYSDYVSLNDYRIFTLVFTDIGAYDFKYTVKYQDNDNTIVIPNYQISVDSQHLTVFGFQLHYNKDNNGDSELKYVEFNSDGRTGMYVLSELQNDITIDENVVSGSVKSIEKADVSADGVNIADLENKKPTDFGTDAFVSTNQAPLWFENLGSSALPFETSSKVYYAQRLNSVFTSSAYQNRMFFPNKTLLDGYYIVVMNYKYSTSAGIYNQTFMFRVNGESPRVEIRTTSDQTRPTDLTNTTVLAQEFTNKNVFIDWTKPGRFENSVSAVYSYSANYNREKNQMTTRDVPFNNDTRLFTENGSYIVDIIYAGNKANSQTISFVIDKDSISGISAKGVYQITDAMGNVSYIYNGLDYTTRASVDKPFTLLWNKKASGANIKVEYCLTELIEDLSIVPQVMNINGTNSYLPVQYIVGATPQMTTISEKPSTSTAVSNNYCFSANGFYWFRLTDEAGNSAQYFIFLDKTNASFLQSVSSLNTNNIVSSDVNIFWGSHKTIVMNRRYNDGDALSKLLADITNSTITDYASNSNIAQIRNYLAIGSASNFYYNIPLTQVTLTASLYNQYTIVERTFTPSTAQTSSWSTTLVADPSRNNDGEYMVKSRAESNVLADGEYNWSHHFVIMNTDNAQVVLYGYQQTDNAVDGKYVSPNHASNYAGLRVEWMKGTGDYEVESITLQYYGIDLTDTDSVNYPYVNNPTRTITLHGTEINTVNGQMRSDALMLTKDTNGDTISAEGKYIITRKYVGSDDTLSYTYYIDRSSIIEYNSDNDCIIGQNIAINAGDRKFNNFQKSPIETPQISIVNQQSQAVDILLNTNKLPTSITCPTDKFYSNQKFDSLGSLTGAEFDDLKRLMNAYALSMDVFYAEYYADNGMYVAKLADRFNKSTDRNLNVSGGNNYKEQGYYIVKVYDSTASYDNDWRTIMSTGRGSSYTFSYKVENENPTGYFYGQERNGEKTSLINYLTTKDSELSFEIHQPTDPFIARVNENNITITRSYIDLNGAPKTETYLEITTQTDGTVLYSGVVAHLVAGESIDSTNNAVITTTYAYSRADVSESEFGLGEYYKANDNGGFDLALTYLAGTNYYTRQSSVINFNLLPKNVYRFDDATQTLTDQLVTELDAKGNTLEYSYSVTIHYEGKEEDYTTATKNFFSNTQTMTIDHTPPTANVTRLLSTNATWLTKYGYTNGGDNDLYEFVQNDINGERYYSYRAKDFFAFSIGSDFTLLANTDDSASSIYYRKMTMSQSDSKADRMPSVLQGDVNYNDYSNEAYREAYRFSTTNGVYKSFGNITGSIRLVSVLERNGDRNADGSYDGYYEIVELDDAGNSTSFVVLLDTKSTSLLVEYTDMNGNVFDNRTITTSDNGLTGLDIKIKNIVSADLFQEISLVDSTGSNVLFSRLTNANTDRQQIYDEINEILTNSNAFYYLQVSNRFGTNYSFGLGVTTTGKTLNLATLANYVNEEGVTQYYLDISNCDNDGLNLTKVELVRRDSSGEQITDEYTILHNEGKIVIMKGTVEYERIEFLKTECWYYVYLTDSANRRVEQAIYVGGQGEITIDAPYIYNNVYYSIKDVSISYKPGLYSPNVTLMRLDNSGSMVNENVTITPINDAETYYSTIILNQPRAVTSILGTTGGRYEYTIQMLSTLNNLVSEVYTVVIDNRLPAVNLLNDNNENKNGIVTMNSETPNTSTSDNIIISWADMSDYSLGIYDYSFSLERRDNQGEVENIDLLTLGTNNRYYISRDKEGTYIARLSVSLGETKLTKMFSFTVASTGERMYSVNKLVDGNYERIEAQDSMSYSNLTEKLSGVFDFSTIGAYTLPVDVYFVNGDYNVVVNGDKGVISTTVALVNGASNSSGAVSVDLKYITTTATNYSYSKLILIVKIDLTDTNNLTDLYLYYSNPNSANPARPEFVAPEKMLLNSMEKSFGTKSPDTIYVLANKYSQCFATEEWATYFAQMNSLFVNVYYNNSIDPVATISMATLLDRNGEDKDILRRFPLTYAGQYSFEIYDKAGNRQVFKNSNGLSFTKYSLTLMTEVPATINGNAIVDNACYNGDVMFEILNSSSYASINCTIYRNGEDITNSVSRVGRLYTITGAGTYKIVYDATHKSGTTTRTIPTRTVVFTIINPDESRLAFDFTTISSSYDITKVEKIETDGTIKDVTTDFKALLVTSALVTAQDLETYVDANGINVLKVGNYKVYYSVSNRNLLPDQDIAFNFRISNQTAAIYSSLTPGETTTKTVTITYNPYVIYRQLGECVLHISNFGDYVINESTITDSLVKEISISGAGTYYVQLLGVDDCVMNSFVVEIKEPLNTLSIVLIVLVSLVLVGGLITFLVLRHRMRVR